MYCDGSVTEMWIPSVFMNDFKLTSRRKRISLVK